MGRRQIIQVVDDLDGTDVGKTGESVTFGLDGRNYEIDLSAAHAEELRSALSPYIKAARRIGRQPTRRARSDGDKRDLNAIRKWASSQGYQVSPRGRVPAAILEAYDAAN